MKHLARLTALALVLPGSLHADQFLTGQTADLVLGQDGFGPPVGGPTHHFSFTLGVAMDPTTGKVFVCDSLNHRILRFSSAAAARSGSFPEAVFGQPNFTSVSEDQGGTVSARSLDRPACCHVDSSGRLWVADTENNRILMFLNASNRLSNSPADFYLGQGDFTTSVAATTRAGLNYPTGVWMDAAGNLWIADFANHRVICHFDVMSQMAGDDPHLVLGQSGFGTAAASSSQSGMNNPGAINVDAAGRLWVADYNNHRVLRFDAAATLSNGAPATRVLGQAAFGQAVTATTATGMNQPFGVLAIPDGTLFVADYSNSRILGFRNAAAKANGSAADFVLGQPGFTSLQASSSGGGLAGPCQLSPGPRGSIYVADYANFRVVRYSPVRSPVVTITTRSSSTKAATATIRGRASSPVTRVTGRVGTRGTFQNASGTTSWTYRARLKTGRNVITILARGPGGTSTPRTVTITRR